MIYPNDPEGLFTTLTAIVNTFAGYYFCLVMLDFKNNTNKILQSWIIMSLLCLATAYPLTFLMPLNKKIWSISFTFLTIGISGASLIFFAFFVDILGHKGRIYSKVINFIIQPFIWLGRNPLIVFVLMDALAIFMIKYIIIDDISAWSHFYHYVFASWISDTEIASTVFAFFFVLLWTAFAGILYKFKIFIRL